MQHSEEDYYNSSFAWWEKKFGFWPLFIAVGTGPETINMTGYPHQFSRIISSQWDENKKKSVKTLRPKGEIINRVLLSFNHMDCIMHKFSAWEDILCIVNANPDALPTTTPPYILKYYEKKLIGHTKRKPENWIKIAKAQDGVVQACTPELDPRGAQLVRVRNLTTKKQLEKLGYKNVSVFRPPAPNWWY